MNIGELFVRLTADPSGVKKGARQAGDALDGFARKAQTMGRVGGAMTAGITLPLVAIGGAAITAANNIDQAMKTIRRGTGATGADLARLGDDFKSVFASVPASAQQASQAIADLNTRTGATGVALQALAAQTLNLARISGSELGATIASTTRVFGDWGIATDKQAQTLDTLWKVSQSTGIAVDALATKLVQFGAPLRQVGFSFAESAALMGKWEKEGVNAELVLGSLRVGLAKFAKAGVDAPKALQAIIDKMTELGPGAEATALAIKTFGARAGPDMAAAITEGRFAIDELLRSLEKSPETIARAAAETNSFADNMTLLKNQVTLALQPLGAPMLNAMQSLTPLFVESATAVTRMAEGFGKLPGPVQATTIAMGGLLLVAGPLLSTISLLAKAGPAAAAGLGWLAKLGAGPIALATGAVVGLGAGFVKLGDEVNKARKGIVNLGNAAAGTKQAVAGMAAPVPGMLEGITVVANATGRVGALATDTAKQAKIARSAIDGMRESVSTLTGLYSVMTERGENTAAVTRAVARAHETVNAALARQGDQLSENALRLREMLRDLERVKVAAVDLKVSNTNPAGTAPQIITRPITFDAPSVNAAAQAAERLKMQVAAFTDAAIPAGRSVLSIADAMGALSNGARRALTGVLELVAGIRQIQQNKGAGVLAQLPGMIGIIGGAVSLLSGLFGGRGPSPAQQELKDATARNTEALNRMRLEFQGFKATADNLAAAQRVATQAMSATGRLGGLTTNAFSGGAASDARVLAEIANRAGLSLLEFNELVRQSGIQLYDSTGNVIPSALDELAEMFGLMAKQVDKTAQAFANVVNTVNGFNSLIHRNRALAGGGGPGGGGIPTLPDRPKIDPKSGPGARIEGGIHITIAGDPDPERTAGRVAETLARVFHIQGSTEARNLSLQFDRAATLLPA